MTKTWKDQPQSLKEHRQRETKKAWADEGEFILDVEAYALTHKQSYEIVRAANEQNYKEHWDVMVNGKKIDVKRVGRFLFEGEQQETDEYHWIEDRNYKDEEGWLWRSADAFAFQTFKDWVVVGTLRLRTFMVQEANLHLEPSAKQKLYRPYRQKTTGSKAVIVAVPTMDLRNLSAAVIPRTFPDEVKCYAVGMGPFTHLDL